MKGARGGTVMTGTYELETAARLHHQRMFGGYREMGRMGRRGLGVSRPISEHSRKLRGGLERGQG